VNLLKRLRCLFSGHDWPRWADWELRANGVFVTHRTCCRCPRTVYAVDGTPEFGGFDD
jgi:hypothetical protein